MNVRAIRPSEIAALTEIWLRSVRATHGFLSEADIAALEPLVRDQVLPNLEVWVLCGRAGLPIGFMAGRPFPLLHLREVTAAGQT